MQTLLYMIRVHKRHNYKVISKMLCGWNPMIWPFKLKPLNPVIVPSALEPTAVHLLIILLPLFYGIVEFEFFLVVSWCCRWVQSPKYDMQVIQRLSWTIPTLQHKNKLKMASTTPRKHPTFSLTSSRKQVYVLTSPCSNNTFSFFTSACKESKAASISFNSFSIDFNTEMQVEELPSMDHLHCNVTHFI